MYLENTITGSVQGNHGFYYPILTFGDKKIDYRCSCGKNEMCKHVIALALSWIYNRKDFLNLEELIKKTKEEDKNEIIKRILKTSPDGVKAFIEYKK